MKMHLTSLKFLLLFIMLNGIMSCSDVSGPFNDEIKSGIKGVVVDTSGQALENVKVFSLYYTQFIPPDISRHISIKKNSNNNDFKFNLEQNFPNPFSNSTFLRYSLPNKATVNFNIIDKNNEIVYQSTNTLQAGYFQYFLGNIVDSLQLLNGPYSYNLMALTENGNKYSDSKNLFIISDKGKPNSTTDKQGIYTFDYKQTFEGDSLVVKSNENDSYIINLTNTVYLLFEKKGYYSKTIRVTLLPNLMLIHDVVLIGEK